MSLTFTMNFTTLWVLRKMEATLADKPVIVCLSSWP
jgi:hypothetical protein